MKLISLILLALPIVAGNAWAHGGGLNKEGCHNDRKNGGYHCHRGSSAAPVERRTQPANQLAPSRYAAPARSPGGRAFANCSEARAAGAAPVRRGDPGYGPHLDRDNDGIGCEPYKGR
jgi:hypothetical protein